MRGAPLLAILVAAGCGGTLGDEFVAAEERCAANLPPAAPTIATPFEGSDYLQPEELAISASAFTDVDGDEMGAAEVEIWAVSPSGVLTTRVWSASFATMPAVVKLDDGAFDLDLDHLQEDTRYATTVRYRDARAPLGDKECAVWGPWSEPRYFAMDNGSRAFFDERQIQDIYIEIPPESWGPIDQQARPPGCVPFERTYYTGAVTVGGQRYDRVGVKTKGGCGSSRNLSGKASFKINLEWDDPAVPGCPDRRRHAGQRSLTLNNGVQDRTASHERVAYAFYHAMGVGASRIAHARVHVNGSYWGLYQLIETVERPMLKRWYGGGGMLYEGTYWCDVNSANLPVGDADNKCLTREFHPTACDGPLDPGDDPITYDPLRDLVAKINEIPPGGFLPAARQFLDVDEFISMWAASSVLGHWDSYELNIINNYRIYHDPKSGLWHFLPSGLDQTMASDVDPFGPQGRVARKCLENVECKALFAARLREAAATFEAMDLVDRARAIHDQIQPALMADPRKEYDMGTWESANNSWRSWIANRPAQIRQKLANAGFPGP
jgi:spore coat protein CotH